MPSSSLLCHSLCSMFVTVALVLLGACGTPATAPRVASPPPPVAQETAATHSGTTGEVEFAPLQRSAKGEPEVAGENGWWATRWSAQDAVGFFGKPVPMSSTHSRTGSVIIRYAYYATEYDAASTRQFGLPTPSTATSRRLLSLACVRP